MKYLMFSDSLGSTTTTFIMNDVKYVASKGELTYVAGEVVQEVENVRCVELPYAPVKWKEKLNWMLWSRDWFCSFKDSAYADRLNKAIQDANPDLIHCHFGYESLKLLQNLQTPRPLIVHFHGYDASEMLRKTSYVKALSIAMKKFDMTPIVVSNYMRSSLEKAGLDMSKAVVLRYGIDLELFDSKPSPRNDAKFRFLQVSSFAEKKGHEITLLAISKVLEKRPELRDSISFSFTGSGGERLERLKEVAAALGIQDVVYFIGVKKPHEVKELLKSSDFFMHHSITSSNGDQEGIPNAIIEAMAMELPVLSTMHAGIPELVEHGVNGLLCNEGDADTYAMQIIQILEWKKKPENRRVVEHSYNLIKHQSELEKIYHDTISRFHS